MKPLFKRHNLELEQVDVDVEEIQAVDAEKVARQKVIDSYQDLGAEETVIVDDTGFFVNALGSFPGSLAYFFSETVGVEGLLPLLQEEDDRSAYFETAIAAYNGEELKVFTGRVDGRIPKEARGEPHSQLPYDSYFIPEGTEKTFAEDPSLKRKNSHRLKAAEKMVEWLDSR